MKIKILIPVYNDWQSVSKLIDEINNLSIDQEFQISIIVVNDASNHDRQDEEKTLENIQSIKILNMKKNQGHTRCIATGLKYIYEKEDFDYVIPMDGDGEDRPEEIKEFINQLSKSNDRPIIGERVKRSENLFFKICYQMHKLITLTFTGKYIRFGNYTCLPKTTVEKMINEKATWNSFSGTLTKIENGLISIPSIRGNRYFGPSKMSFYNLIKHSLSIISVFRKTFLIRSALFIILYILLIKSNASVITAIPLIFLLIAVYSISNLSLRENMDEFDKSLENIRNIDTIK
jgi:glycosyltransferase involved in cell wall biosynthesis